MCVCVDNTRVQSKKKRTERLCDQQQIYRQRAKAGDELTRTEAHRSRKLMFVHFDDGKLSSPILNCDQTMIQVQVPLAYPRRAVRVVCFGLSSA